MASSSSRSNTGYHVRSASFPSTSHPTTIRVEAELNKLQTREASATPTAEMICSSLSSLEELYRSVDDLLNFSTTQNALSHYQNEKWVNEILDGSMRLLDICGSTRDVVTQIKEHDRDLQSALRRRKGDFSMESSVSKYTSFQKKIKKDAKRLIASLKQMENKIVISAPIDLDNHVSTVKRVLREVSALSTTIFQSILILLSLPVSEPKTGSWPLVSKLIHKGEVSCEVQLANVKALEGHIEGIENGLEGMFRRLIATRASLLNIISS
ncbi:hypothetical protein LguiB_018981 [Lonicera macranthoides]